MSQTKKLVGHLSSASNDVIQKYVRFLCFSNERYQHSFINYNTNPFHRTIYKISQQIFQSVKNNTQVYVISRENNFSEFSDRSHWPRAYRL